MKFIVFIPILIVILGCNKRTPNETKIIDTDKFEIEVPADWKYKKAQGEDSFVGRIIGNGVDLSFDWSEMGYANPLIASEKEFVYERDWEWMPSHLPYGKEGVIYTSGNVQGERERIMKEKGINDTLLVRVEPFQIPEKEIIFQDKQYKVILTYKDTVVQIGIQIPEDVKNHQVQVDTTGIYKRKLIRPREGKIGITGVYFEDLNSTFNFNLAGEVVGLENQEKAINSFKTIKIKRNKD
ncbi:hypothetical protein GXP67_02725 [Rhodocytophaga rosea]|uniref:Uncharacterized protein n=1 Tax=Rhodocytophaga rosea TaxID=2704465 RepID=A0A6C0GCG9_9BACT|nr:hypothetical protein [Rhodocytophaga rosea]QHT65655.1 hypothetical protein GXP67_02725 [Rhodocytophaga rosea]